MSWVGVGLTAGSAIIGGQNARAQNKAKQRQNQAAAEQTEWSAWTGMGPGQIDTSMKDAGAAALQGGLGGYMQGQAIKGSMAGDPNQMDLDIESGKAYGPARPISLYK